MVCVSTLEDPNSSLVATALTPVAASVELIDPSNQEPGFQIDCGTKLVGGHSLGYPKQSMRLYFRDEYGPSKLQYPLYANKQEFAQQSGTTEFDQLHLRSGSHDSIFYLGADNQPPSNAQYIRNRWIQDTMFRMGHLSTRGRFVQVYLNGNYHGLYHLQERPTRSYLASYLGGDKADYAYVNSAVSDDLDVWAQVKASLGDWDTAQSWIDMDSLIDYQLLSYYAGNDWDWLKNRNWMAAGPRIPGAGGWKFFPWDSDISFISETANNTDPNSLSRTNNPMNAPDGVFTDLRIYPEFLERVHERAQLHFYGDGLLTPSKIIESYQQLADEIEPSLVAETARWGNEAGANWRPDTDWQPEKTRLLESFFVNRTQIVLGQLQAEGLLP